MWALADRLVNVGRQLLWLEAVVLVDVDEGKLWLMRALAETLVGVGRL